MHARRFALAGLALIGAAALSAKSPQLPPSEEMTVVAFLERVDELRRGGPNWTLTPEAGQLFAVVSVVGKTYRQNLADRLAAGQTVEACLPPEAEIDSDVLFQHLTSYSGEAAAQTTLSAAFSELVRQRYPCS